MSIERGAISICRVCGCFVVFYGNVICFLGVICCRGSFVSILHLNSCEICMDKLCWFEGREDGFKSYFEINLEYLKSYIGCNMFYKFAN